jgi:hypothetical protein
MRYVLRGDPDHPFSEAIGVVMSVGEESVSIVTKRGAKVEVPLKDILAMKVFPI